MMRADGHEVPTSTCCGPASARTVLRRKVFVDPPTERVPSRQALGDRTPKQAYLARGARAARPES